MRYSSRFSLVFLVLLGVLVCALCGTAAEPLWLVKGGRVQSVVVCGAPPNSMQREGVEQFVRLVERSTGAKLAIVSPAEEKSLPPETVRLFVGSSPQAAAAGVDEEALSEETYRILRKGNALFVAGKEKKTGRSDAPNSRPTLWALNRLLEEGLGVRWLWPGELGTYVPKKRDFPVAIEDLTFQPSLEVRSLRMRTRRGMALATTNETVDARLRKEALLWAENHLCGKRGDMRMSHAFTEWWEKYSQTHPDYFAELPPGYQQPHPKPERVKLRLSNPAVIEQIVAEYEAAGKPDYWNICPNDSAAFDISEGTRAWDLPKDQPIEAIFTGKANLTARYVEFWNRLYDRLVKLNPNVKLVGFAYSSYRQPPPPERPLRAKMVLGLVNSFDNYKAWEEWAATGASLVLRPNWWYLGEDAPYLPLKKTAAYIQFAFKNGMIGMDMDSVRGYWGAQGINYYVGARLMTRPELTLDEIIHEYTAAFGQGASKIREYLAYWEKLTDEYNYQIVRQESEQGTGRYGDLVREGKVPASILGGSKPALVYLYTDEVLAPAYRLLDEAAAAIGNTDSEALQRVEFLRRGLRGMVGTRDQMQRAFEVNAAPTKEKKEAFVKGAAELRQLRDELSVDHSVWGESAAYREHKHKIPVWPIYLGVEEKNFDGQL